MRINVSVILAILIAVGGVAFIFTAFQISAERDNLNKELESKTIRATDDFFNYYLSPKDSLAHGEITDSVVQSYGFAGIIIYYNNDSITAVPPTAGAFSERSIDHISRSIASDSATGQYFKFNKSSMYEYISIIHPKEKLPYAVAFYSDARYIDNILNDIWLRSFLRWFLQAMLISALTLLIIRRSILKPINKVVEWVKAARFGNVEKIKSKPPTEFLQPLYKEISGIAQAIQEAKAIAQEEARLRTTAESVWTPERLSEEMKQILENKKMVIVSNREPYMHVKVGNEIQCIVPASGMVTAMEPIVKACGGLWIASGSGDADRETVDEHDKVQVPPYEDKYTLRRIWLTKEQEHHYYYGFSNEGLWPLCHIAHTRPVFRKIDWDYYKEVNELYAKAVIQEIKDEDEPFVLVQDYHFALLPQLIKEARSDARVALFWHIPWPNPESFGICPWKKEILNGLLGADLLGFHTQYHCNNFLETVNHTLESRVIWENFSVKIANHFTLVKPFPISIAFTSKDIESKQNSDEETVSVTDLLKKYGINAQFIGIGVDRIDYTKGLLEKFLAIERFLEKTPSYVGRFTFVQIGAPSRSLLKTYSDTTNAVEQEANRINFKFKAKGWQPILFLKGHHSHQEIQPFYEAANFCMVTSLHDGMNLVAKEYVASKKTNDGVLILSQFAGASQELHGALIINPYDIEESSDAILAALEMPYDLQQQKMKLMRRVIMKHNVYSWGAGILRTMASIEN
jgi:trehalose 6-phosphate synthase